ncbi:MAG: hypothetical protein WBW53_20825 [Terriglobales bacterium]
MRIPRSRSSLAVLAAAVLTMSLLSCNQAQPPASPATSESKAATSEKVFVIFEGPWAIVADPKDANSVLVLAPKTKLHRDLYVSANDESTLPAGIFDLSVPAHGLAAAGALDMRFAQAKIDPKNLQRALDDKSERYVIRLPKPEAYLAAKRVRSRVGSNYPPNPSTEQNYASYVSFLYNVSTLSGFSLAGTPDSGAFNPLLLQLETPTIRFAIEPAQLDNPADRCHTHSREAFRETTLFLGLTLYLDFPNDSPDCHKTDPQLSRSTRAQARQSSVVKRIATLLVGNFTDVEPQSAIVSTAPEILRSLAVSGAQKIVSNEMAFAYFFHGGSSVCEAPILFLTTS